MSAKQLILNTVQGVEETQSYEDILYILFMQMEIKNGIEDMEKGNVKTTEELKEIIEKW